MKNLLYKEFRLSVHPLTYFFIALLAMSALSPSFPSFVPLLYFGATYTFLFIGMNKTTTTNDLFYTCTLPIRRQDVVKARICSTTVIQLVELVLVFSFFAVSKFGFIKNMPEDELTKLMKGTFTIDIEQWPVLLGAYFVCFAVFDLIYLPWFYRTGKSIIANMLVGMLTIVATGALLTVVPYYTFKDAITFGGPSANYLLQFLLLGAGIAIWIGSKFLVTYISEKNLKKLDF